MSDEPAEWTAHCMWCDEARRIIRAALQVETGDKQTGLDTADPVETRDN